MNVLNAGIRTPLSRGKKLMMTVGLAMLTGSAAAATNGTMMQYFHWDSSNDGQHWNRLRTEAGTLVGKGITAFWIPPAYKGQAGINDVGYGVYDLYDLGEFQQKGTQRTKYGLKNELHSAIDAIHLAGAQVYGDVVLNHMMGADGVQRVTATRVETWDRNREFGGDIGIDAWTRFTFPGRKQTDGTLKYSNFTWQWYHFDGVDWAANLNGDGCARNPDGSFQACRIYKFRGTGKSWDPEVSSENGNYDYLMGADLDFQHPEVRTHLKNWGVWFTNTLNLDGFRIDATKHISASYFNEWLGHVRQTTGKLNAFAVSEYWERDLNKLLTYTSTVNSNGNKMSVFDVPLHHQFMDAGNGWGGFDMGSLAWNNLAQRAPTQAATFVDNHDTLTGAGLQSQVQDWFKPQAYSFILLRQAGYPIVFLGDYRGVTGKVANHGWVIDQMLKARKHHAYGQQFDYFDHSDVVGWTRVGDAEHRYGVAVVMNDNQNSTLSKRMFVGTAHANQCFVDVTNAVTTQVCADGGGWGTFPAPARKATVWVRAGKFGLNT